MSAPSERGHHAASAVRAAFSRAAPSYGEGARCGNRRATLSRLAAYFTDSRPRLYAVAACVVFHTFLRLLGPYLVGVALDRHIRARDASGLTGLALLLLSAYALQNLFEAASGRLMAEVSQHALRKLRSALFRHVQTLPMAFFAQQRTGELMSRMSGDLDTINQALSHNSTALMGGALTMLGIVVAMFALDSRLALASLLVVPSMLWFTRSLAALSRQRFRTLQQRLGQLHGVMEESISGCKTVLAFGRTQAAVAEFQAGNEQLYRAGVAANSYALLLMPLTAVLGNLFVVVLVGLGGLLALQGLVSVGVIAAFLYYGQDFVQPLRQISNQYNTLQAALAGAERVFEILDRPSESDAGTKPAPQLVRGHVRFERVSFGYRSDTTVIDDLSLEATPGQTIALVGANGAGKTTLMELLTRFYEIDRGTIRIDGGDIRQLKRADLRRLVGTVAQDTYLFATTVMENLRYGRLSASDEEVVQAARAVFADDFIRQLAEGYQTRLAEGAGNLSKGQRQLLSIARTLLADPAILLLDEATSSVDSRTELRIRRALSHLMAGRTSFVIAHRLSTIRHADKVLVVDGGKVVESGTHRQLLAQNGVYSRLYHGQFER